MIAYNNMFTIRTRIKMLVGLLILIRVLLQDIHFSMSGEISA